MDRKCKKALWRLRKDTEKAIRYLEKLKGKDLAAYYREGERIAIDFHNRAISLKSRYPYLPEVPPIHISSIYTN